MASQAPEIKSFLLSSEFKQRENKKRFLSRKMQQRLCFLPNNLRMSGQKHPNLASAKSFSDKSREEKNSLNLKHQEIYKGNEEAMCKERINADGLEKHMEACPSVMCDAWGYFLPLLGNSRLVDELLQTLPTLLQALLHTLGLQGTLGIPTVYLVGCSSGPSCVRP